MVQLGGWGEGGGGGGDSKSAEHKVNVAANIDAPPPPQLMPVQFDALLRRALYSFSVKTSKLSHKVLHLADRNSRLHGGVVNNVITCQCMRIR